jgi:hypothetical protein
MCPYILIALSPQAPVLICAHICPYIRPYMSLYAPIYVLICAHICPYMHPYMSLYAQCPRANNTIEGKKQKETKAGTLLRAQQKRPAWPAKET